MVKKKKDPKVGTGKNPKVVVGDYTQMKIQKILSALSLQLQQMQEQLLLKLKELKNLLQERYKFSQSSNKEPKSQVKRNKPKSPRKAKKQ